MVKIVGINLSRNFESKLPRVLLVTLTFLLFAAFPNTAFAAAPSNTKPTIASASISGTAQVGFELTASAGATTGNPSPTLSYQWKSSNSSGGSYSNISGATQSKYTIQSSDYGYYIKVTITASNGNNPAATATSSATSQVAGIAPTIASASISGTLQVGQRLTATAGAQTGTPTPTLSYQWQSSSSEAGTFSNISGARSSSYTLQSSDAAQYIRVTITASNSVLPNASATSTASSQVLGTALTPTFSTRTSTYGGFTFNVTNYDSSFTYSATATNGTVSLGSASGSTLPVTVRGLTSEQGSTITINTSKTSYANGSASTSGTALASAITTSSGPMGRYVASAVSNDGTTMIVADQLGYLYTSSDRKSVV